ncbi:MAG: PBSX family phage terminase large subunit [Clostridia bacterium]|nr:PBSX family phage terminase large subunit [Clostridia bacterium]
MARATKRFTWGGFSRQGLTSIAESTARLNIWEGAVRSSKTICSLVRWLEYVKAGPPGDLLMTGKTERTLKRNILDPIESIVGRGNFRCNMGSGEARLFDRRVYIAGANDERSESKIRGVTLAGAYGDELTLWPESFFRMLLSRLSVEGASLFGTTNPDGPMHWLKVDYLDRAGELNLRSWHFELEDNPNLSREFVESLKREYTGLWYKRFISGLWVMAEGAVYDMWDEDKRLFRDMPDKFTRMAVGVDYGTANPTAFVLAGQSGAQIYVPAEYYYDSRRTGRQKTDSEYAKDLKEFIAGKGVQAIVIDPSAASFIAECRRQGIGPIRHADNSVLDGIRDVSSHMSRDVLFVHENCKNLRKELSGYVWDAKAQAKGEDRPVKVNDHAADALRYVIRTIWPARMGSTLG